MRVFFDEDVPRKLARFLAQHQVHTVTTMGWNGMKNGVLLAAIEHEGFDVFLTGDKNMQFEQRLETRSFAVLVMSAVNWPIVEPHVGIIAAAVDAAKRGTVAPIECGAFRPKRH